MKTFKQLQAERALQLRPTRRPCLEKARKELGPFTKFRHGPDQVFQVTLKLPRQEHIVLGESKDGWLQALEDAITKRNEARKALEPKPPPILTAAEMIANEMQTKSP